MGELHRQTAGRGGRLIGRADELRVLVGAFDDAQHGHGSVSLVSGEPGIGKTTLLREVAAQVDGLVCWSGSGPNDVASPYRPWIRLVDALARLPEADTVATEVEALVRLLSGAGSDHRADGGFAGVGAEDRQATLDTIEDLLHAVAARLPLLLILEDLHWADDASLRLLEHVAPGAERGRLALVGTYRDTEFDAGQALTGALPRLATAGPQVHLGGMSGADFEALVRSFGDVPVGLDELHRRTGGNPLFCREIMGLLRADPTASVPAGVRAVITDRLSRLTSSTREVLDAAGVLGGPVDLAILATVAGVNRDDVAAALDEAEAAGLVSLASGDRRADFVHALVGETISEALPTTRRLELHRVAARAIDSLDDADRFDEVAHHALASASAEDISWAADRGARAADHAMSVLAYEEAATWCERTLEAVRLEGSDERLETDLLLTLGEACLASGDVDGARAAYARVAAIARRTDDAVLLARAALGLGLGFGAIEVRILDPVQVDLLQEALASLGPEPTPWRVWVLARLSVALSLMGREDERVALSDEAVETARRVDDPAALGHALTARCDATAGPDHCERRARDGAEIVEIAVATGDMKLEALGRRHRVVALMEVGRVAEADAEIRGFAKIAERLRQPRYEWYVPLWQGMRALMRGDSQEAGRLCDEAEAIAKRAGSPAGWLHTYSLWWTIQRATGGAREAGRTMTELLARIPESPAALTDRWAVAAVMSGELDRASALLEQWLRSGLDERVRDSEWLPEAAQVAEAAIVIGNRDLVAALFERLRPYDHLVCVEGIGAAVSGSVAWFLAMMAAHLGRTDLADHYRRLAVEMHARIGLVGDPPPLTDTLVGPSAPAPVPAAVAAAAATGGPLLVHEGATWALAFGGRTVRVRDSKGVRDLAVLLAQPDREVHSIELMGGVDVGGAPGPVLDSAARQEYERRIRSLQEDVDDARQANDLVRAERAEAELDALVDQLSRAFGLGGRDRAAGAAAERARSAVTWRIRAAIRAVSALDPDAGAHLAASVRTGTWCAYRPDPPLTWQVEGP